MAKINLLYYLEHVGKDQLNSYLRKRMCVEQSQDLKNIHKSPKHNSQLKNLQFGLKSILVFGNFWLESFNNFEPFLVCFSVAEE